MLDASALGFILLALKSLPSLVDSGRDLLRSIEGLSPEQSDQLQAAQQAAHDSLQSAVTAAVAEETALAPVKGAAAPGE